MYLLSVILNFKLGIDHEDNQKITIDNDEFLSKILTDFYGNIKDKDWSKSRYEIIKLNFNHSL